MKISILYCFFIIVSNFQVLCQNLVQNPSFELIDKYGHVLQWTVSGFINGSITDENIGCLCNGKDLTYHSCKTMATKIDGCSSPFMFYLPNCDNKGGKDEFGGCSIYVHQKLETTLNIGDTFRVSFWVYIPSKYYPKSGSEATKHIGFLITNKPANPNNASMIKKDVLCINPDSITVNKWIKMDTCIVATCELNYLTIGVFKEQTWQLVKPLEDNKLHYFLDKISIEKTTLTTKSTNFNYNCNEVEKDLNREAVGDFNQNIYFDNNSDVFKNMTDIDSFANYALKHPQTIFYLSGHTDNTGSNNMDLSKRRVENFANYLKNQYNIPNFRLIVGYFGDKKNDSKTDKEQNRRVNIKLSPIKKGNACYREALKNIKEDNFDNAFNMLNCWLSNESDDEKILILFDPQLEVLKKDKRWKLIESGVVKVYKKYKKPNLAFVLDSLYCEDQKYRRLAGFVQDLAGYNEEIDTALWSYPIISEKETQDRDSLIYQKLKSIIHQYGYPKQGEVGKRSAKAASVIIIHSHDTIALKKYIAVLESHCKEGEGDWGYYAAMYDKLCTLENVPQRYGTQFVTDPKKPTNLIRYKFDSKDSLNDWRRKIALPLLTDDDMNISLKLK